MLSQVLGTVELTIVDSILFNVLTFDACLSRTYDETSSFLQTPLLEILQAEKTFAWVILFSGVIL